MEGNVDDLTIRLRMHFPYYNKCNDQNLSEISLYLKNLEKLLLK